MKFKWFAWGGLMVVACIGIAVIIRPHRIICRIDKTSAMLNNVAYASKLYKDEFGTWPSAFSDLTNNPKSIVFIELDDQERNKIVYIPFNQEVGYGLAISWGADGEPGGVKQDRDRIKKIQ